MHWRFEVVNNCETTITTSQSQLTFVLPLSLHETGLPLITTHFWRQSPDDGVLIRTRLLLSSFVAYFNQDHLAEFLVIAPERDVIVLLNVVRSVTHDPRYKVIPEMDVCPNIRLLVRADSSEINGWQAQQLLKLAIASSISTDHYVTLDSDIVCARAFSMADLVHNGSAVTNRETLNDYQRLYTDAFAEQEAAIKLARYARSGALIGCRCLHAPATVFYGETPVVLCKQVVLNLQEHLGARFACEWSEALALTQGWTEYTLYFHYLDFLELSVTHCCYAGCNSVLDLERSIWEPSVKYRNPRVYNKEHFLRKLPNERSGIFIAVQSWLPLSSWLPTHYSSRDSFYCDLERWILDPGRRV